ncbi:hypothetical protein CSB66_2454 [Enterobacter hormaechei]|uniref:hypothetical protein n=1 Tax=Enterobacter cloacae complex TaxID=354276 RepID=UPI0005ED7A39|nr:hypothetical protein [Enterobacter hormaechei]ELC7773941.1 hypothetical protein [Enterobacter hormaechei]KJO78505.1 hypothetical protein SR98_14045 [Enterobacter hormaechei subsp. xiangfangensis]KJP33678.1 hypothetical protein SR78_10140 [Enterobacter hormaechei subsp. xiangfangensis]MDK3136010.1 hypothetical protein [Enterobacter hormaechei]RCG81638.1 hypothetical protein CSB66_2454 [Enterobacter hormaechei]
MFFPYSEKQKQSFLNRFGQKVLINDKENLAIIEKKIVEDERAVTESMYITADENNIKEDDTVKIKSKVYTVSYIVDDGSGLVDAYLSLISDTNRGSKYV